MSPDQPGWADPRWENRKKHVPNPKKSWEEIVAEIKDKPAFYHPDYASPEDRQALELECVQSGTHFKTRAAVRCFYRKMELIIGASDGKETEYVYAEWHQDGTVHGRPITWDELSRRFDK